jgi:hypothetical protein
LRSFLDLKTFNDKTKKVPGKSDHMIILPFATFLKVLNMIESIKIIENINSSARLSVFKFWIYLILAG